MKFAAKTSEVLRHCYAFLGHLGRRGTDRMISICITSLKVTNVANASKTGGFVTQNS
jgi:hypothetical protein